MAAMTTETLKTLTETLRAIRGVATATPWTKAAGRERIYVELTKHNGGRTWNGGTGGTVIVHADWRVEVKHNWAGAATARRHEEIGTVEAIKEAVAAAAPKENRAVTTPTAAAPKENRAVTTPTRETLMAAATAAWSEVEAAQGRLRAVTAGARFGDDRSARARCLWAERAAKRDVAAARATLKTARAALAAAGYSEED